MPDFIKLETNIDIALDEGDVLLTQTAIHTLLLTAKCWESNVDCATEDISLISNHYVLCNHTQDTLHVQQVSLRSCFVKFFLLKKFSNKIELK